MLNLCLSADHEIFFGENHVSEQHVVIDPTDQLLALCGQFGVPLTLFTDICSIWRYKELGMAEYPRLMEQQMSKAISRGHDVQLHLHPHWLKAVYNGRGWSYNPSDYRLHSLPVSEIRELIAKGKEYLESLLQPVDPEYRCIAFRAGGWCLQPEKEILQSLLDQGIMLDSTVFRGGYRVNGLHDFDFRGAPAFPNYWIDPDKGVLQPSEKAEHRMFEVQIGSYTETPGRHLQKLRNRWNKLNTGIAQDRIKGLSADQVGGKSKWGLQKLVPWFKQPIAFSYDGYTAGTMLHILNDYLNKLPSERDYYISIIGHPKVMDTFTFEELGRFLRTVKENYHGRVEFTSFRGVAESIGL